MGKTVAIVALIAAAAVGVIWFLRRQGQGQPMPAGPAYVPAPPPMAIGGAATAGVVNDNRRPSSMLTPAQSLPPAGLALIGRPAPGTLPGGRSGGASSDYGGEGSFVPKPANPAVALAALAPKQTGTTTVKVPFAKQPITVPAFTPMRTATILASAPVPPPVTGKVTPLAPAPVQATFAQAPSALPKVATPSGGLLGSFAPAPAASALPKLATGGGGGMLSGLGTKSNSGSMFSNLRAM